VIGRAVFRPSLRSRSGADIALTGDNRRKIGAEANVECRGAFLRGEYIADRLDGRDRDDFGWYLLGRLSHLAVAAGDRARRGFPSGRRPARRGASRASRGLNFDLPGGQTRFIADYEGTTTGAARTRTDYWIAQLQVKF
jgi:hypothetical protein